MRRSRRIQLKIPVAVVSLKPDTPFSERCETVVVNEDGCGLRPPTLPCGIPVRLELLPGKRIVTGRIVGSTPVGAMKLCGYSE